MKLKKQSMAKRVRELEKKVAYLEDMIKGMQPKTIDIEEIYSSMVKVLDKTSNNI